MRHPKGWRIAFLGRLRGLESIGFLVASPRFHKWRHCDIFTLMWVVAVTQWIFFGNVVHRAACLYSRKFPLVILGLCPCS